jgi:hypothetical protein
MRFMSTLCALALITPVAGFSQTAVPDDARLDVGSRVRIAAPVFGTRQKEVATVVSVTPDTVVLRFGATTPYRSLASSDITSLEVSRGTHTRKAQGALWGLLLGAGAGAVMGYTLYEDPKCKSPEIFGCLDILGPVSSPGSTAAISAVGGGIVGALIGTLVGMRATDSWVPATVSRR